MDMYRAAGWGLFALAGAGAATAAIAPLYDGPGGLALAAELNHPVLLAVLSAVVLTGGALLRSRRADVRTAAAQVLAGAAALGALAVPAYGLAADPFPDREWDVAAPDGSPRRLVVERTDALTDPVWRIYVDAGPFPTARRWPVAEYRSGPDQEWPEGVLQAAWSDPDHIELTDFDHTAHTVRIARDGRPLEALVW
ncbi:hypothetical protein AB0D45_16635 [Streptomyces sp. NPDC048352]|uniref:hypothetical protein n=1 Tax=Streptomyces sp. NPDC048352 TaxID=3154718 RepID=UPI003417D2E7